MDIVVVMCEDCVRKLKGRVFKSATRRSFASLRYCVTFECSNEATFVVSLRLPERKVIETLSIFKNEHGSDADIEASLRDYADGRFKRGSIDDLLNDLHAQAEPEDGD